MQDSAVSTTERSYLPSLRNSMSSIRRLERETGRNYPTPPISWKRGLDPIFKRLCLTGIHHPGPKRSEIWLRWYQDFHWPAALCSYTCCQSRWLSVPRSLGLMKGIQKATVPLRAPVVPDLGPQNLETQHSRWNWRFEVFAVQHYDRVRPWKEDNI